MQAQASTNGSSISAAIGISSFAAGGPRDGDGHSIAGSAFGTDSSTTSASSSASQPPLSLPIFYYTHPLQIPAPFLPPNGALPTSAKNPRGPSATSLKEAYFRFVEMTRAWTTEIVELVHHRLYQFIPDIVSDYQIHQRSNAIAHMLKKSVKPMKDTVASKMVMEMQSESDEKGSIRNQENQAQDEDEEDGGEESSAGSSMDDLIEQVHMRLRQIDYGLQNQQVYLPTLVMVSLFENVMIPRFLNSDNNGAKVAQGVELFNTRLSILTPQLFAYICAALHALPVSTVPPESRDELVSGLGAQTRETTKPLPLVESVNLDVMIIDAIGKITTDADHVLRGRIADQMSVLRFLHKQRSPDFTAEEKKESAEFLRNLPVDVAQRFQSHVYPIFAKAGLDKYLHTSITTEEDINGLYKNVLIPALGQADHTLLHSAVSSICEIPSSTQPTAIAFVLKVLRGMVAFGSSFPYPDIKRNPMVDWVYSAVIHSSSHKDDSFPHTANEQQAVVVTPRMNNRYNQEMETDATESEVATSVGELTLKDSDATIPIPTPIPNDDPPAQTGAEKYNDLESDHHFRLVFTDASTGDNGAK